MAADSPVSLAVVSRAAAVAGVLAMAVAATLLVPRGGEPPDDAGVRALLVDASASVRRRRPAWPTWARRGLAREAARAQEAGEDVALVVFASEVRLVLGPAPPEELLDRLAGAGGAPLDPAEGAGNDGETRLSDALAVAAGLVLAPGRRPGTIVLLGPGTFTGPDPGPELLAYLERGATFERRHPGKAELADLAFLELSMPEVLEAGAPLGALARLRYEPGSASGRMAEAELLFEIENAGVRVPRIQTIELPPGPQVWSQPVDLGGAGFGRIEVRGRALLPLPDPVPENDGAVATGRAEGARVVGVLAEAADAAAAASWLFPSGSSALPGLELVPLEPQELALELDGLDAVVSYDLAPGRLPAGPLERFVRSGGGWLVTGGWRFLAGWTPGDLGALGDLLPLEPAPLDRSPRDVVLLVDGSGSMAGEPFETVRAASLDLVSAALPSDRVGLRFFTTHVEPEHVLRGRGEEAASGDDLRREAARRLLSARVPGGPTYILRSLEQLAEERAGRSVGALALLLTDGREREARADPSGDAGRIVERLEALGVRLFVVAVGDDPDLEFLTRLTPGSKEPARAEGLGDLRKLFRRAVAGGRWREAGEDGDGGAAIEVRIDPLAPAELVREVVGEPGVPLPGLERVVKNQVRPEAFVLWKSDRGEPVLGIQRVGLGRSAVFSSLPDGDWAPGWSGRPGVGEPRRFGPLLRWLARGRGAGGSGGLRAELTPGGVLAIEGFDSSWPAVVPARIVDAAGGEDGAALASLELMPPATGASPLKRRLGELPAPLRTGSAAGRGGIVLLGGGEGAPQPSWQDARAALPLPPARPPELTYGERQMTLPPADPAGGAARPRDEGARRGAPHPAAAGVLLAGMGVFLAALLAARAAR